MSSRSLLLGVLTVAALAHGASAQVCPVTSTPTNFLGASLQTECSPSTGVCTSKSGVTYDTTNGVIRLPGAAGNFQPPSNGNSVPQNVFFAAAADFDRDGWDDFVAASQTDLIYMMRNQTITCDGGACGYATRTVPSTDWDSLTFQRKAAFRPQNNGTTATVVPIKAALGGDVMVPMVAGDFDGDGWQDVAQISLTYRPNTTVGAWPTAARMLMNTRNCRLKADHATPCGYGKLCTGQASNGACTGGSLMENGAANLETNLSCTSATNCTKYYPTFAVYDLRTGAANTNQSNSTATAASYYPGDFGPMRHAVQNMATVDWDGDGDLDLLFGHSTGTCPGTGATRLCQTEGRQFYTGISVWKNDCNEAPEWNNATKACVGHIPTFSRSFPTSGCTASACADADELIPSTSHNNSTLVPSAKLGFDHATETPAMAYVDIDQDNDYDLVLGSPGCCSVAANADKRLRIYRGISNSPTVHTLDTTNPIILSTSDATYPGFEGSLTGVFVLDFSVDGWPDIITGSDGAAYNSAGGGRTRYWKNSGNPAKPYGTNWPGCGALSATCNPNPTKKLSESCGSTTCENFAATPPQYGDFDIGFFLDYDHDPQRTKDMVLTNGNDTNQAYVFPNRASAATVSPCGTVASGVLDVPTSELTIQGACIKPTSSVPSGASIKYYLNNEDPTVWQLACTQTSAGFSPALNASGQCCVTFPSITGRKVQWKADFDSNNTDDATANPCSASGSTSPTITSIDASYVYSQAAQYYRAGVVVNDGLTYAGSFSQPGERGHLYAIDAALSSGPRWDAGTKLDAMTTAQRNIYTSNSTGVSPTRLAFTSANAGTLQALIGASTPAQATTVIDWVTSARFGYIAPTSPKTKLGAVVSSTPAVMSVPYRPNWYSYLPLGERGVYDTFASTNASRLPLVMFGAKDGMVHAVYSNTRNNADPRNGKEAWAFVPPATASTMKSDYTATITNGATTVTGYPDGPPTLLDYKKTTGSIATAAIIGMGAGGTSLTALDVTNTAPASSPTTNTVTGPTPLWTVSPASASSAAGQATSKAGVARAKIGANEVYVVVAGTGPASDASKGKVVSGFNLQTGALMWSFEMMCALTTDITILETDDSAESGAPTLDGFADRAVFADKCGYVYKVDPGKNLVTGANPSGWMDNTGFGSINLASANGVARRALFSAQATLGSQRPITGTIGARIDNTNDVALYFGTGGLEGYDPTLTNYFVAIYMKNGALRSRLDGSCTGSGPSRKCEKFYGGVVLTPDEVITQRTYDAVIGATCDFGKTTIASYAQNSGSSFTSVFTLDQIEGAQLTAIAGPLYGDAGALYFATMSGEIGRVGTPRVAAAGGDSSTGYTGGMATVGATAASTEKPFSLMGWRVVL